MLSPGWSTTSPPPEQSPSTVVTWSRGPRHHHPSDAVNDARRAPGSPFAPPDKETSPCCANALSSSLRCSFNPQLNTAWALFCVSLILRSASAPARFCYCVSITIPFSMAKNGKEITRWSHSAILAYILPYVLCLLHVRGGAMFSSTKPLYVRRERACAIMSRARLAANFVGRRYSPLWLRGALRSGGQQKRLFMRSESCCATSTPPCRGLGYHCIKIP